MALISALRFDMPSKKIPSPPASAKKQSLFYCSFFSQIAVAVAMDLRFRR
jgi:hypothetical protein